MQFWSMFFRKISELILIKLKEYQCHQCKDKKKNDSFWGYQWQKISRCKANFSNEYFLHFFKKYFVFAAPRNFNFRIPYILLSSARKIQVPFAGTYINSILRWPAISVTFWVLCAGCTSKIKVHIFMYIFQITNCDFFICPNILSISAPNINIFSLTNFFGNRLLYNTFFIWSFTQHNYFMCSVFCNIHDDCNCFFIVLLMIIWYNFCSCRC